MLVLDIVIVNDGVPMKEGKGSKKPLAWVKWSVTGDGGHRPRCSGRQAEEVSCQVNPQDEKHIV